MLPYPTNWGHTVSRYCPFCLLHPAAFRRLHGIRDSVFRYNWLEYLISGLVFGDATISVTKSHWLTCRIPNNDTWISQLNAIYLSCSSNESDSLNPALHYISSVRPAAPSFPFLSQLLLLANCMPSLILCYQPGSYRESILSVLLTASPAAILLWRDIRDSASFVITGLIPDSWLGVWWSSHLNDNTSTTGLPVLITDPLDAPGLVYYLSGTLTLTTCPPWSYLSDCDTRLILELASSILRLIIPVPV